MNIIYPLKREKYITQHFGENPDIYSQFSIGGVKLKGHEGIDLRAETGTEVVACDGGFCQEVLDQGSTGYGKYIKIIHSWGESVYAHLQEFKVKQGTNVTKGQTIALSDNTGNSIGPHLHFGIRINPYNRGDGWGGYSDPEPYLFGDVSTEEDMPFWAKNLKPFFIENQLKDDQIEGSVREAFDKRKVIDGFIVKWSQELQTDPNLGMIEDQIGELMHTEDLYNELRSACEQMLGGNHYETDEALRIALQSFKVDMDTVCTTNDELVKEVEQLKKKRVLDRYKTSELLVEVIKRWFNKAKEVVRNE